MPITILEENLKKGDVFVDIGARIGSYTTTASFLVGKEGKVYSFEPEPNNFEALKKKTEVLNNIVLRKEAVSNQSGKATLYFWKQGSYYHRLYKSPESSEEIEVETTCMDDFFNSCRVDFVSIDAVGSEAMIIQGMKKVMEFNPNLKIMMDFCPERINGTGFDALECLQTLKDFGYKFKQIRVGNIENIEDLVKDDTAKYLFCYKDNA